MQLDNSSPRGQTKSSATAVSSSGSFPNGCRRSADNWPSTANGLRVLPSSSRSDTRGCRYPGAHATELELPFLIYGLADRLDYFDRIEQADLITKDVIKG
jgi:hypothetical protein